MLSISLMIASDEFNNRTIRIFEPETNYKCVYTLTGHEGYFSYLIQLSNGMIAFDSVDSTIKI